MQLAQEDFADYPQEVTGYMHPGQTAQEMLQHKQLIRAFNNLNFVKFYLKIEQQSRIDFLSNDLKRKTVIMPAFRFVGYGRYESSSSLLAPNMAGGAGLTELIFLNHKYDKSPMPPIRNAGDIRRWICLNPMARGILIETASGFVWKYRTEKSYRPKELFDLRFDSSKVKGDLKEWLYSRIRDIYEESDCDDPRINPLTDDKREELWHEAALLFRRYNQRATHINHLPCGTDAATLPMIKPDTVNNNILQILTLYDGPGSKRQRRFAPEK